MKSFTELLPLAVGVAIVGAVTWLLLSRGWALGPWLLAVLLFAHGWVHLLFVFPQPEPAAAGPAWPFDMAQSWLVTRLGVDVSVVRPVGMAVMAVTFVGFLLAALATVGLVVPTSWWGGLVVGAAAGSIVLMSIFFSPSLVLGVAIDVVLVWVVVASLWSPVASDLTGGVG